MIQLEIGNWELSSAVEQWTRLQPMPVYLLQRQPESPAGSGCVWCISGALRGLVAAEELAEWSDALVSLSICLQVRLYRLSMRTSA